MSQRTNKSAPNRSETMNTNQVRSTLHLLSETGFTQQSQMNVCQRLLRLVRLPNFSEYFMSVDHHQIWRRHLAWSFRDGECLRNAVVSRFASNMVFMSLLLGTEIGVLFSPSQPADIFRAALKNAKYADVNFWAAIVLCISIGLTLSTLVANFTAWAIISAVSPQNAHTVLRSSIGLTSAQLPARLVILSIYSFVGWMMLFLYILAPPIWGFILALLPVALIAYIVIIYSSFGRLVIYSRAMQQKQIFNGCEDNEMSPSRLFEELLKMAEEEKEKKAPLPLYYRSKEELSRQLSELRSQSRANDNGFGSASAHKYVNKILNSSARHYPAMDDLSLEDEENGLPQSTYSDGEVEEEGLRPRTVRGYSSNPSRLTPLRGASTRSLMESPGSSSHVMALTS